MRQPHPILKIAIPCPMWQYFDYLPPISCDSKQFIPGVRVIAPWGRRQVVGILMGIADKTELPWEKLKFLENIIDDTPIMPSALMQLIEWSSQYYHYPIGEIIFAVLPKALREGKPVKKTLANISISPQKWLPLNNAQEIIFAEIINANSFKVFLLDGVTGSGKTEIYLHCIRHHLLAGKQALVLVPEIGLTPQTVHRFQQRFQAPVLMMHSNLTIKEKLLTWNQAMQNQPCIIIGTRSAVFMPFTNLGIIVVDEEHDLSYKQQSKFRYHARNVAIKRAQLENIPIILGSATPALESYHNVMRGRHQKLQLSARAGDAILPKIELINLRQHKLISGISIVLLEEIKQHLNRDNQVLLFLNRRGFAPILMCHQCGWHAVCAHCDARMTLHYQLKKICCHYCGLQKNPPRICPSCQQVELSPLGQGTEKLELNIQQQFPNHTILRIDRDTTRTKNSMAEKLDLIHSEQAHILIGTQMLAKGHHFPKLSLVAIVDADSALYCADFRATERMAQLLIQVAGRAGREKEQGKVFIQTHHPEHPLWNILLTQDYASLATTLLAERKNANLPPYHHIMLIKAESKKLAATQNFLTAVKNLLLKHNQHIVIQGPLAALLERKAGYYRYQLLLRSENRNHFNQLFNLIKSEIDSLPMARQVRWFVDVDPQEI